MLHFNVRQVVEIGIVGLEYLYRVVNQEESIKSWKEAVSSIQLQFGENLVYR
jgi:hypothetical protein